MKTDYFCPYCNSYRSNPAIERKDKKYNINGVVILIETDIIRCDKCGRLLMKSKKNIDIHKVMDMCHSH